MTVTSVHPESGFFCFRTQNISLFFFFVISDLGKLKRKIRKKKRRRPDQNLFCCNHFPLPFEFV